MAYNGPPREWLVELGNRLALARDAAGLSQEGLAIKVREKTGIPINRNQIQQYESGISDPPGSKLDAIAFVLGIEVSSLTGKRRLNLLEVAFNDDDSTEEERGEAFDAAYAYLAARRKRRMQ